MSKINRPRRTLNEWRRNLTDIYFIIWFGCGFIMLNVTFNNISDIAWSFIGGETEGSGKTQTCCDQFHSWKEKDKNHRSAVIRGQTLSQNVISSTPRHGWDSNSQP